MKEKLSSRVGEPFFNMILDGFFLSFDPVSQFSFQVVVDQQGQDHDHEQRLFPLCLFEGNLADP